MIFELTAVAERDRSVLENLTQLYLYDFSEHFDGAPFGNVGDDGRFRSFFRLDDYWRRPGSQPFLMRLDGKVAGFALVGGQTRSELGADACVDEFFVLRTFRRQGIGRRAAHALFERLTGQWEVGVVRRNTGATAFWRTAVRTYSLAVDVRELDSRTVRWDGPIFRFVSRMPAAVRGNQVRSTRWRQAATLEEQIRDALSSNGGPGPV
jgi:predicted acetyltransferase